MSEPIRFMYLRCQSGLSDAVVLQRMQNPPGKCRKCGSHVIQELEEGASKELSERAGVKSADIKLDPRIKGGFRIEIDGERVA